MNRVRSMLFLLAALLGTWIAWTAVANPSVRFQRVDIFIDSKAIPLAAYQLEFRVSSGEAKVVGVEGGEHPAFKEAPFYDPKAIQHERVIIAAFNTATADKLPLGRTRVATVHLQITGEPNPSYSLKLETAATLEGREIAVETAYDERKPE